MIKILFFILAIIGASSYGARYVPQKCTEMSFLPMPKSIKCTLSNQNVYKVEDPCSIIYLVKGN